MATKYFRVSPNKWEGVYFYESTNKTFDGKPDQCFVVSFKVNGKKVWEKVGWRSKGITAKVADEYRTRRVQEIQLGAPLITAKERKAEAEKRNRTIGEVGTLYFGSKGNELKGLRTDINRYQKHIAPLFGRRRVPDLTRQDMEDLKLSMGDKADATKWNALELLRRIINYGAKHGYCPALPFTIEMPRRDNERVEYMTPEEVSRFFMVMQEWPNQEVCRMLKLSYFTAMRKGEIFGLQDTDVDFQFGIIRLRAPKGGKSMAIAMNPPAKEILLQQMAHRNHKQPGCPYVFPGKSGERRVECTAADRLKDAAGLPKHFRIFHGLRHHFAVTLANSGQFTLDMLAEMLTHKSTAMTKRYGQFLPETMRKAAESAGELLSLPTR
jgi:integrase